VPLSQELFSKPEFWACHMHEADNFPETVGGWGTRESTTRII
jgi:hypothetical protein